MTTGDWRDTSLANHAWGQEQFQGNTMRMNNQIIVKVNKAKLLETLRGNLTKHVSTHTEALETWKQKAAAHVATLSDRILKGEIRDISNAVSIVNDRPVSYAPSYEKVIKMLEYSVDDIIELESEDFDRYVGDNWEWKQSFLLNSTKYGSGH